MGNKVSTRVFVVIILKRLSI